TIGREGLPLRRLDSFPVRTPEGPAAATAWETEVDGVPVALLEEERYLSRARVYGDPDDADRWLVFCDAVLAAAERLGWRPDVLHLNEWHAAFAATRLRAGGGTAPGDPAVVYTIHNLAIRGDFDAAFAARHGLPEAAFRPPDGVDVGLLYNGMAQGIRWADAVNTVSPTYAREILTPEFGAGLDPLLRWRAAELTGILNGIDTEVFDPRTDPHIPARFHADALEARAANKAALQDRVGLPRQPRTPLLGMVTRLFHQKGTDLAAEAVDQVLQDEQVQFVVLGTGDAQEERRLAALQEWRPHQVAAVLAFDPALAQLIYAGCDLFLMPSRFEPCGLGQMLALRYGAVPVVRKTGGLADTVVDYEADPARGNGFVFQEPTAERLAKTIRRALDYYGRPERWRELMLRGMQADFSWDRTADRYVELYRRARAAREGREDGR
ncbi:MAG TPA: glycogen/starch synthase, partial [Dehalococcoidia bacterium]